MKRISILLAILAWATLSHAWESKTEYRNASGDQAYISVDATTGNILIQNPDDEEGYGVLRTSDIGSSVMAYSTNLAEYAAVNPVADALTRLTLTNAELGAALGSDKHEETITLNNQDVVTLDTRTETDGYTEYVAKLDPQSSNTGFTFAEHGFEVAGDIIKLVNISSANKCTIESNPSVLYLPGTTTLKPGGWIEAIYIGGVFNGASFGATQDYLASGNLNGGATWQAGRNFITATGDVTITTSQLNSDLLLTGEGAKTVTLPINGYTSTALYGGGYRLSSDGLRCKRIGTADVFFESSGTGAFVRETGAEVASGNKLKLGTSSGDYVNLQYGPSDKIYVWDFKGATADGGAATLDCLLYDEYDPAITPDKCYTVAAASTRALVGGVFTLDTSKDVCKVSLYDAVHNGESFDDYDFYLRFYSMDGDDLDSVVANATSTKVNGADFTESAWIDFEFTTAPTLAGTPTRIGWAVYAVVADAGADATPQVLGFADTWCMGDTQTLAVGHLDGELIATEGHFRWNASGVYQSEIADADTLIRVYTE